MTNFVPLNKALHAAKSWRRPADYAFASSEALAPVVGLEVAAAAVNMPLAFVRNDRLVQLVAVTGLQSGTNLFVGKDGRWVGAYVPGILRSFPFRLARVEGREDMALCVAEEYVGDDGDPLYDDAGNLSSGVKQTVSFLEAYEKSRQQMTFAAAALSDAGVLTPWQIKVKAKDGQERAVAGLLRVDEKALNALDEAAFAKLRKVAALPIAYAQLLSMSRLEVLSRLAEFHARVAGAAPGTPGREVNLDFLREDDGSLVF
ncbi:SapC family protein [Arvimicrobium flavum]|uniref:SapC family protein n=1 Tax=Arvimicrobium flavum TaxID=3393320 RepID=UPI00237A5F12|nr:SapC family protein [Mesorhizobium shangrilense]